MSSIEQNKPTVNKVNLRADLELIHASDGSLQIRDPLEVRYFYVGSEEAEVIMLLHDKTLAEILAATNYSEAKLKQLLTMLNYWELLDKESLGNKKSPQVKQQTLLQSFFKRNKLLNPDELMAEWAPKLAWLGSNPLKIIYCLIAFISLMAAFDHGNELIQFGWPAIGGSWLVSLVIFVFFLFVVLFGHEIAHGLSLKHFGGTVPELGFYFIYLTPSLYTDISDMYKLPKKGEKIWIMMAGPIFQGMVGCLAFLLWCAAEPDTYTKQILYLLSAASFFSLSFNLNPLVKLDGYFALEFATNIFSLRTRAWSYFLSVMSFKKPKEEPTDHEKLIFMLYAPLSLIFTAFLMMAILSFYFVAGLLNLPYIGMTVLFFIIMASNIYVQGKPKPAY